MVMKSFVEESNITRIIYTIRIIYTAINVKTKLNMKTLLFCTLLGREACPRRNAAFEALWWDA